MPDATFDPIADLYDRFATLAQDPLRRWTWAAAPAGSWTC